MGTEVVGRLGLGASGFASFSMCDRPPDPVSPRLPTGLSVLSINMTPPDLMKSAEYDPMSPRLPCPDMRDTLLPGDEKKIPFKGGPLFPISNAYSQAADNAARIDFGFDRFTLAAPPTSSPDLRGFAGVADFGLGSSVFSEAAPAAPAQFGGGDLLLSSSAGFGFSGDVRPLGSSMSATAALPMQQSEFVGFAVPKLRQPVLRLESAPIGSLSVPTVTSQPNLQPSYPAMPAGRSSSTTDLRHTPRAAQVVGSHTPRAVQVAGSWNSLPQDRRPKVVAQYSQQQQQQQQQQQRQQPHQEQYQVQQRQMTRTGTAASTPCLAHPDSGLTRSHAGSISLGSTVMDSLLSAFPVCGASTPRSVTPSASGYATPRSVGGSVVASLSRQPSKTVSYTPALPASAAVPAGASASMPPATPSTSTVRSYGTASYTLPLGLQRGGSQTPASTFALSPSSVSTSATTPRGGASTPRGGASFADSSMATTVRLPVGRAALVQRGTVPLASTRVRSVTPTGARSQVASQSAPGTSFTVGTPPVQAPTVLAVGSISVPSATCVSWGANAASDAKTFMEPVAAVTPRKLDVGTGLGTARTASVASTCLPTPASCAETQKDLRHAATVLGSSSGVQHFDSTDTRIHIGLQEEGSSLVGHGKELKSRSPDDGSIPLSRTLSGARLGGRQRPRVAGALIPVLKESSGGQCVFTYESQPIGSGGNKSMPSEPIANGATMRSASTPRQLPARSSSQPSLHSGPGSGTQLGLSGLSGLNVELAALSSAHSFGNLGMGHHVSKAPAAVNNTADAARHASPRY